MSRNAPKILMALACVLLGAGCAGLAKKPPTPAADISPRDVADVAALPGERYFILVFGSQCVPKRARYTHAWATVVRVSGCGPDARTIEEHTISWMPASLEILPLSFRVEPGTNLPLHVTIDEMRRNGERISVWGPYEVRPGLARRFQVQKAFLESGAIGYQCIDTVGEATRTGSGCDCIHAITDMDPLFSRSRYPLAYFGDAASVNIVRELHTRPLIIDPQAEHGWLLPLLHLDQDCVVRRTYHGRTIPYTPENYERYLRRHGVE